MDVFHQIFGVSMQCQNWFEPGQEMGEGEMTQLVPVRWLVLAGAGWAARLQITDSRSGAELEMLHRYLETGDWRRVLEKVPSEGS